MLKLYKKSRLAFALVFIGIYVIVASALDGLSETVGIPFVFTAPFLLALGTVLLVFILKNGFKTRYGLYRGNLNWAGCLFFIPLAVIVSMNFLAGVNLSAEPLPTILGVVSMLAVGFIEEIIFRGFLFKAMAKDNIVWAFVVSTLTFALGHIVNLFNGADILSTLLQITYAGAGGFLFTTIFYKTDSLIPCIITHSLLNASSVFMGSYDLTLTLVSAITLTVVSLLYALWFFYKYKETDFQLDGE
ncbi:MAG: CPBP family intramembrane metalloprotease [Clostridia bacterium]|nr:CPBP family intramembrane metalloprotease [Clostridia bacterium]